MDTKQRTKLELIRIEGIWRMLLKKVKDDDQLSIWVDNVTGVSTKDVRKAITRLSRYQLIRIIELAGNAITSTDIDEAYEQYRYGLKPGFTLFSIQKSKDSKIDVAYKVISEYLSAKNYVEGATIKNISAKSFTAIDSSVVEFAFFYHIKHSYLNEKEEPNFIYEYKECFAWIDILNNFLVIQNSPDKVLSELKSAFVKAYAANIGSIKLTRKLIKEIFGDEQIKKGTFINPNASDTQAEKITLSDSKFSEKESIQQAVSGYDMTGTYLNQTVGDDQPNTLGINCNKGRLYLTSNVSASLFREWSIEKIKSIIDYLQSKANYEDYDLFRARNLTDYAIWSDYNSSQKIIIEQLLYSVYVAGQNGQDSANLSCTVDNLRRSMRSAFYTRLTAYCDTCEDAFIPLCGCGRLLSLTNGGGLICPDCGSQMDTVHCEEGHDVHISGAAAVILFPTALFINKFKETLLNAFGLTIGTFSINNGVLTLISEKNGYLVPVSDIPELKAVMDIKIAESEYEELRGSSVAMKEKCRTCTNENCNACDDSAKRSCIMKIFTTFPGYRPSPHQANEFGDVSFTVTHNQSKVQLVGIAKSSTGNDTLTLSESSAREMLQQVLTATHDARVGIIGAICATRFHDQLTEELRYIAALTGKPIVILDDSYMIRQLKAFNTK